MKPLSISTLLVMILIVCFSPMSRAENLQPQAGQKMPPLILPVPGDPAGRAELGLDDGKTTFGLSDLKNDLVLLEVIGVYCPQCFIQAPEFNKLYARLNKGKTQGRVAMFALAAGATDLEIEQLISSRQYRFPVVKDMVFEAHKLLGEPKTPFTIICRPDGTVLFTHLGIIEDIDTFYGQIKAFLNPN
jgi:peroxiredoxin